MTPETNPDPALAELMLRREWVEARDTELPEGEVGVIDLSVERIARLEESGHVHFLREYEG